MKTYDAILVLGKKLKPDGDLIDASMAMVKRAVNLFNQEVSKKVIFSGKWYFQLDPQPITEAQAMASYANSLGLPDTAVVLEEQSDATITNIYFTKKILKENNWKSIVVINFYPFADRAMLIARKVLGQDYQVDLDLIEYELPSNLMEKYIPEEKKKYEELAKYFSKFEDGDDEGIYKGHLQYLKDNGFMN